VPENILVVAGTIGKALHFKGIVWTPIQSTQRTIIGEHSSQEMKKMLRKAKLCNSELPILKGIVGKSRKSLCSDCCVSSGKDVLKPNKG